MYLYNNEGNGIKISELWSNVYKYKQKITEDGKQSN